MQNIIMPVFDVTSEGYQAITALSQKPVTEEYTILEMALIQKTDNKVELLDSFESGIHTTDDLVEGGLVGSMIGIVGGPLGMLLGGSMGALTGSIIDLDDADNATSMIECVAGKLWGDKLALIILAEEKDEAALDAELSSFQTTTLRFDAAVVAAEVEEAKQMQEEMERQARLQLRATKKEERKQNVEEKRQKLSADFEAFKAKFKN